MTDKPQDLYAPTIEENFTAAVLKDEYKRVAQSANIMAFVNVGLSVVFAALTGHALLEQKDPTLTPALAPALALAHLGLAVAQRHRAKQARSLSTHCTSTHDFDANSYRPRLSDTISEKLGVPATQELRMLGTTALLVGLETGASYFQITHGHPAPWDLVSGFQALAAGTSSAVCLIGSGCSFLKSLETPLGAGVRAEKRFCANHPVRFS